MRLYPFTTSGRAPHWLPSVLLAAIGMAVLPAHAQVQRSFLNPSFETPALTAADAAAGCYRQLDESLVPGWTTTHRSQAGGGSCTAPGASTGRLIELWRTNFLGVVARDQLNFSELNAEESSRIYQNICFINGERINWRFSHRGRSGSALQRDVMELKIGASSTVVRVGTSPTGTFDTPIVSQGTANAPVSGGNGWVDYAGSFDYAGANGVNNLGFESISAVGGIAAGNFLDAIQIELSPFVEFVQPSSATPESATNNVPTLRVNGTVAAAFNVTINIVGGTAVMGTDYTTPGNSTTLTVNIPAGTYDGGAGSLFPITGLNVVNDAISEGNETILFQIAAPAGPQPPFLLASNATCGAPVQTTWTYTIVDNDGNLSLVKSAAAPTAVAGQPTQFDVVYTMLVNNPSGVSSNYSLIDTPGFDPNVNVVSAGFTLNGGAANALPVAGPWTLQPQWRALAAGATDTYSLTVRININRGGTTANDSCASPSSAGSGLHNSASATLQGSSGNPNSNLPASACRNTPTPVWVTLNKTLEGRFLATDQAQIRIFSGGILSASAITSGIAEPANASTGLIVLPVGNTMQFEETIKANGGGADLPLSNYRPQIVCSNASASGTVLPSGAGTDAGNRQQWAEFTPAGGDDIACTITNAFPRSDLAITKTNNATSLVSGTTTTYDIVVTNNGPEAVSGAMLRDPAPTGLTGCTIGTPACTATPGSTCPGALLTVANLQTSGVPIPLLANGGSVTVKLTCTVP